MQRSSTRKNEKLYEKLEKDKEKLELAQKEGNIAKINICEHVIKRDERSILNCEADFRSIRPDFDNDINERKQIFDIFHKKINEVVPDDIPMVFHGNNNIEVSKLIIESGGLLTPEEQGFPEGFSYASQIDVTSKTNTRITLEFAEPGLNKSRPYGAIFAFIAKDSEKERVLETKNGTEVPAGVNSIKFTEQRFVGVITTNENLEKIKQCLKENGFDENKAFTHENFLKFCEKEFSHSLDGRQEETIESLTEQFENLSFEDKIGKVGRELSDRINKLELGEDKLLNSKQLITEECK